MTPDSEKIDILEGDIVVNDRDGKQNGCKRHLIRMQVMVNDRDGKQNLQASLDMDVSVPPLATLERGGTK